ncbi:MAG: hypothetical protein U0325_35820 [Polyangiales bacterium]
MKLPHLAFGTPRKLPRPESVPGRVAVLDIAFAAEGTGTSFEKVTGAFLTGLGDRLAAWVDHHDHAYHARYRGDPRFVLCTKAEHGACPEMVTPELVARVGAVDSVLCHTDLDGLYAAAKWARGGVEPYPGADDDARAVDTRIGSPSQLGGLIDRALRVDARDPSRLSMIVRFLAEGARDDNARGDIADIAARYDAVAARTQGLAAERYRVHGGVAWCEVDDVPPRDFDKTELLLLGQQRATISVVVDTQNVSAAAAFDSGVNLLAMFGVAGGMPTRVSVPRSRYGEVREALRREGYWRDG